MNPETLVVVTTRKTGKRTSQDPEIIKPLFLSLFRLVYYHEAHEENEGWNVYHLLNNLIFTFFMPLMVKIILYSK
jgi:hypothetical protein